MYRCPTTISSASDNFDSDARNYEAHGKKYAGTSFNKIARPHAVLDAHFADLAHYHGNAELFLSKSIPFDIVRAKASQIFDEKTQAWSACQISSETQTHQSMVSDSTGWLKALPKTSPKSR